MTGRFYRHYKYCIGIIMRDKKKKEKWKSKIRKRKRHLHFLLIQPRIEQKYFETYEACDYGKASKRKRLPGATSV